MMAILALYLCAAVVGVLFRQVMGFQAVLAELAVRMAAEESRGVRPIIYQNSITPPWVTNFWIFLLVALLGTVGGAWYLSGFTGGAISLGIGIASSVVSGAVSSALSVPDARTVYSMTFHSLTHRAADFRRDGDLARADAAEGFCALLIATVGDEPSAL
jgi:hypothetical protein